ncbi:MAG: aminotransferase class V-fold PLP-dependent enzyme [Gemmatimonadetes bacterium]|nr:aminotransferase class V-fold PLP-dependent enzyme [Gemmatimonadota bacterium]
MGFRSGRHFVQIPGPTNVPDRVLRAMGQPTIDHRGPEFVELSREIVSGMRPVFGTTGSVFIFPASASGGWEAALVNTLSPGDRVLMFDHGFFASNWQKVAARFDLAVDFLSCDWRRGIDPDLVAATLDGDAGREYKAVMVVHNETSTGVTNRVSAVREAMDRVGHPALLMVDAVSSLGSIDYCHDAWRVDVTIAGSQKGLMVPPGLCFNAVSDKAMAASESAQLQRSYWSWQDMLPSIETGTFPYTPSTNLLFGLQEALTMLHEEGLEHVYARHARHAEATRRAVVAWGLENYCMSPEECSNTVTTVLLPENVDGDALRTVIFERFDMSLGTGLGKLKGKVFRIGHLGDFNDLMLAGTLCGIEMGLQAAGTPHEPGGVTAAMNYLATEAT